MFKPWSEQEKNDYSEKRVNDQRLEEFYEKAKAPISNPSYRAACLARVLTLNKEDFAKLDAETKGNRPLELILLEGMFVAKLLSQ